MGQRCKQRSVGEWHRRALDAEFKVADNILGICAANQVEPPLHFIFIAESGVITQPLGSEE